QDIRILNNPRHLPYHNVPVLLSACLRKDIGNKIMYSHNQPAAPWLSGQADPVVGNMKYAEVIWDLRYRLVDKLPKAGLLLDMVVPNPLVAGHRGYMVLLGIEEDILVGLIKIMDIPYQLVGISPYPASPVP